MAVSLYSTLSPSLRPHARSEMGFLWELALDTPTPREIMANWAVIRSKAGGLV